MGGGPDATQRHPRHRTRWLVIVHGPLRHVDARAKADQRGWLDRYGGPDAVAAEPLLIYTPPPGNAAEME